MGNTLSVRLPREIAEWLDEAAQASGTSRGSIIRTQLEKARASDKKPFMRLAGTVQGAPSLSSRKGFSRT